MRQTQSIMKDLKNKNIIYISGYGRSGSTLLSLLFNTLPGVANLGEIDNLYSIPDEKLPEYWKQLRSKYIDSKDNSHKKRFSGISWFTKKTAGFALFQRYWTGLISQFMEDNNCHTAVDASKSTYKTFCRPFYYQMAGANVKIVHLVRNPEEVAISFAKGRNSSDSAELLKPKKGGAYRALFNWFVVNGLTSSLYKREFKNMYVLNYDQLMENYEVEMQRLFAFLELELPENLLNKNHILLSPDLSFSGNRVRLNESVSIKPYPPQRLKGFKGLIGKTENSIYKSIENGYR